MNIVIITGIILTVAGVIVAAVGIKCSYERQEADEQYITAEGTIVRFERRWSFIRLKFIPIFVYREYAPAVRYRTAEGEEAEALLPYTIKISRNYREYNRIHTSASPIEIKYSPEDPADIYYGSRRSFRIREAVYKLIVAILLAGAGILMIRGGSAI